MSRKYTMNKRLDKAYENYTKRYTEMANRLAKKGYSMYDKNMLTRREYEMSREALKAEGVTININQTLVSEQAFEYNKATALRFKHTAQKFDLDWKDYKIEELMKGKQDISALYKELKSKTDDELNQIFANLPANVAHNIGAFISYEVFGSD